MTLIRAFISLQYNLVVVVVYSVLSIPELTYRTDQIIFASHYSQLCDNINIFEKKLFSLISAFKKKEISIKKKKLVVYFKD